MKKTIKTFIFILTISLVLGLASCVDILPTIDPTPTPTATPTPLPTPPEPTFKEGAMFGYDENGKTAYDLYKENNQNYSGNQEQWLDDFVNDELDDVFGLVSLGITYKDGAAIFSYPEQLVVVEINPLGQNLPNTKNDGSIDVILRFSVGDEILSTYGKIKVQGSSTASWPKKNFSLSFYSDKNREHELYLKIGDSIPSNKWIVKAEWIDPTILRNLLSFRLWESILNSREGEIKHEVDNALTALQRENPTGAQGFPRTHPAHVKVNKEHYGLSMLLLGHDPNNFNIDKDNPNHLYFEFDARGGYTHIKTWEKFRADGIGGWIDSYYPKNEDFTQDQRNAIEDFGQFINGSLENFIDNFDTYLDKTNMIDMLLFMEMIYDWDAVAQDIEIVTYDLEKFYLLPWDKDTTFGMWWDGTGLVANSSTKLLINYNHESPEEKPWFKTYHAFKDDVEERYAYLRDNEIFSEAFITNKINEIRNVIPVGLWQEEYDRWPNRPSVHETSPSQIIEWFTERLEMLDDHFNYNKE